MAEGGPASQPAQGSQQQMVHSSGMLNCGAASGTCVASCDSACGCMNHTVGTGPVVQDLRHLHYLQSMGVVELAGSAVGHHAGIW